MQHIINFFLRNKNTILFLLLFCFAFYLTIESHSYHKSKFISSSNFITGGIYESVNSISQYFNLHKENKNLLEENKRLKEVLFNSENNTNKPRFKFNVISGQVIKNSYSNSTNYLLINKGKKDGILQDQAVISSQGIIGIIDKVSANNARVISILNTTSKISAQLKKTNHFGILTWDGVSPEFVQLVDMPRQAPVSIGDTIISGGHSAIFPKGIFVGEVTSYKTDLTDNYLTLNIKLFNDMTQVGYVHIINNQERDELLKLENQDNE